jgi:hypothetical protein
MPKRGNGCRQMGHSFEAFPVAKAIAGSFDNCDLFDDFFLKHRFA